MAHHAAGIANVRVQQQPRGFESSGRQDHDTRLYVHLAARMTIEKMRAIREPGVFVYGNFANNGILDDIELAGCQRVGQQEIDRACQAVAPLRKTPLRHTDAAFVGKFGNSA